jgi:hypothetical protein
MLLLFGEREIEAMRVESRRPSNSAGLVFPKGDNCLGSLLKVNASRPSMIIVREGSRNV